MELTSLHLNHKAFSPGIPLNDILQLLLYDRGGCYAAKIERTSIFSATISQIHGYRRCASMDDLIGFSWISTHILSLHYISRSCHLWRIECAYYALNYVPVFHSCYRGLKAEKISARQEIVPLIQAEEDARFDFWISCSSILGLRFCWSWRRNEVAHWHSRTGLTFSVSY